MLPLFRDVGQCHNDSFLYLAHDAITPLSTSHVAAQELEKLARLSSEVVGHPVPYLGQSRYGSTHLGISNFEIVMVSIGKPSKKLFRNAFSCFFRIFRTFFG